MANLILPRRFTQQPQGPVEVDWNHELLTTCHGVFSGRALYTKVAPPLPADFDTVSPSGIVGSTTGIYLPELDNYVVNNDKLNLLSCNTLAAHIASYFPFAGWHFYTYPWENQQIAHGGWTTDNASFSRVNNDVGQANYTDSYPITDAVYDFRINGASTNLLKNGTSVVTGTSSTAWSIDTRKRLLFTYASWGFVFADSGDEFRNRELRRNPWQIFKAQPQRLYFDVAAGGVTNYPSAADGSSFTITGSAASGISTKVGVASSGSYTIIGSSASGTVSKTSAADSGTYTITGSTANAIRSLVSAANLSSYTITGYDAQGSLPIAGDTPAAADSSAYTITGSDSLGTQSFVSAANTGSYTIIGVDALASKSKLAAAESGSYTITGSASLVTRTFASVANSGSYIVTGGIANGTYSGEPTLTLGAGSYRNRGSKKKKTYLVDGILRELTDAEVAEIVSQPIKPNEVPKKIVLEDKPKAPKKEAKEWKIESEVKTPVVKKPVFAKETLKVEDERTIVKHVVSNTVEAKIIDDTSEEETILQFIREREAERRALAKALTWMHTLLGGR